MKKKELKKRIENLEIRVKVSENILRKLIRFTFAEPICCEEEKIEDPEGSLY